MTPTQRRLARHALGLPNKRGVSVRNIYQAPNHSTSRHNAAWREMVGLRFAECKPKATASYWNQYRLTRTGAELALEPGEALDEEDFC